jgi:hypothetical protein
VAVLREVTVGCTGLISVRIGTRHGSTVMDVSHGLTVGRSPAADVRIGHLPQADDLVPGVVAEVHVHRDRLLVSNVARQLAFTVFVPGAGATPVAPDTTFGPAAPAFEVVVEGEYRHAVQVGMASPASRRRRGR